MLHKIIDLCTGKYKEAIEWRVVRLVRYDIILGMPWLEQYNLQIDWQRKIVKIHNLKFGATV